MGNAAKIKVSLEGEQAQFNASMKNAASSISALTVAAGVAIEKVAELGVELAEKAVEAIFEYTKAAAEAIDKVAKLSDALNINVQALRGLEYAAKHAGGETEQLHSALEKMVHSIGDGKADAAFRKLGLSAQQLAHQDAGKSFQQIAEAIKNLKTPAEQAAYAMEIFGKSGVELLPLLNSNLDEASQRFQFLAGSIDRVDAAKIEEAKDILEDVETVLEGLAAEFAVEIAPLITGFAESLIGAGINAKDMGGYVKTALDVIEFALEYVAWSIHIAGAQWNFFKGVAIGALSAILTPIEVIARALDYLYEKLTGQSFGVKAFFDQIRKESADAFKAAGEHAIKVVTFSDFREGGGGAADAISKAKAKAQEHAEAVAKAVAETHKKTEESGSFHVAKEKKAGGGGGEKLASAVSVSHILVERLKHTSSSDPAHQAVAEAKKTNQLLQKLLTTTKGAKPLLVN